MSIALIVNSQVRDTIARYMERNEIETRLVGTNVILIESNIASEIDLLMTFFPLDVDSQAAVIAACMLKETEEAMMHMGVPTLATLPFHTVGELADGGAEHTLMLGFLHPNALLYKSLPGPEIYPSVSGPHKGGIFVLWRGTKNTGSYTIHALGLEDDEVVDKARELIAKEGMY